MLSVDTWAGVANTRRQHRRQETTNLALYVSIVIHDDTCHMAQTIRDDTCRHVAWST